MVRLARGGHAVALESEVRGTARIASPFGLSAGTAGGLEGLGWGISVWVYKSLLIQSLEALSPYAQILKLYVVCPTTA